MLRHHLSSTQGPQRLLYAGIAGAATAALAWPLQATTRALVGWCVAVAVYLVLAYWLARSFDAAKTRARAQSLDQPNSVLLVSMLGVVAASVVVIVMLLRDVKGLSETERIAHVALGVVALAGSWLLIHTLYAFHYAHRYYQQSRSDKVHGAGLAFPGKGEPDYVDFIYYAYVVGMTSQVSDVQVTSPSMRRVTLIHGVLSFGFNMLVLALSVNVVANAL